MFKSILSWLKGKKSYLIAAILAILNFAVAMGWISPENLTAINTVLGALGLAALRAAV